MARRRKTIIKLKELNIYPELIKELQKHPDYSDKDFSTLSLTVLDDFETTIQDVDKAILSLKRYVAANKKFIPSFEGEQHINRVLLAKILGISRQTLTKWIDAGFITPLKSRYISKLETFSTDAVLRELGNYKLRSSGK